jgi:hypothetical protein
MFCARRNELEQPGHDVDPEAVELLQHSHQLERFLMGVARERDDHALDVELLDQAGHIVERPENRNVGDVIARLLRCRVDEADDVDPELRVLEELGGDELADLPRAHEQRVLDVGRLPATECAGAGPRASVTNTIASPQNMRNFDVCGLARWDTEAIAKTSQVPSVRTWSTPVRSSAVVLSARSSSRS